ncbi:MAG: histidinol-phosphatase HisJ family protein [Clostridiales bacterium]|nr:histidinol-phosphatase HisJ family protein [Clostridiales bacterium]
MVKCRFDQHIHSSFSSDSETDISDVARSAIDKGLVGIAVTDHLDPLWPDDDCPSILDVPAYEAALSETENAFADRIQFAKGIELGMIPGEALDICQNVVSGYPYDFVIASMHSSDTDRFDCPSFFEGRELRDVVDEYYTLFIESVKNYKNYDVLGHLNYIDRYANSLPPENMYMPYIDELLRIAVADGKGIEVNTAAFRYGMGDHGTPTMSSIKRFKELGGEIVTLGSDAHEAKDIGGYIKDGEEMLLAVGFHYIAVFMGREPSFVKL